MSKVMGKVTYKNPSDNFEKMSSVSKKSSLRSSIGREADVKEFFYLPTEKLIPYHKQARRYFNQKEIDELSMTIKVHGIQSPLLVINSSIHEGKYEIISGERRYRAALNLNLEKLPCIIIDPVDAEEIAVIENLQRSDLHPIELGESLQSLLSNSSRGDLSKLAGKLGKSHSTLSNYISYAQIPSEIKDHLIEKNIKSREILRKILKTDSLSEMQELLGIKGDKSNLSVKKNILRIHLEDGKLFISSKIDKLDQNTFSLIKEELEKFIHSIEKKVSSK